MESEIIMRKKIIELLPVEYPSTSAVVNNQYLSLVDEVFPEEKIELLDVRGGEGRRTYERTLTFLLSYAAGLLGVRMRIEHSYGECLYGEVEGMEVEEFIRKAKEIVGRLVQEKIPIVKEDVTKERAIEWLRAEGREDDIRLLRYLSRDLISIYRIKNYFAYFAGPLLPDTSFIKIFDLVPAGNGFLVILPSRMDPWKPARITGMEKVFSTFQESKDWASILGVEYAGDLNDAIRDGRISEIIKIQEGLHEKKIASIADEIMEKNVRLVFIAGPSSSGKTTFTKRLSIQLKVNGIEPVMLCMDDYFLEREKTPKNEKGEYDFDTPYALDIKLLLSHVHRLLNGEEVERVKFDFYRGRKYKTGETIKLSPHGVLLIEGIHALNPMFHEGIENPFRIYVSALTQLNIDRINRIPTRDTRLLRRIVRDTRFRGHSAEETLKRWKYVIEAEEKYVFPHQEDADVVFNSALVYEIAVIKYFVESYLRPIGPEVPEYREALRLLNFLSHFLGILPDEVPPTSILREFIGGSSFVY
ncbi:nucleoside kinase [bacterium]|nr:MAG: nucleoside kinase [bacterium]